MNAPTAQKLKVFISYSRKDGDFAEDLVVALEACGFDAYLDQHDIAPGEIWEERLAGLIQAADTIVYVISPDSIASERCVWEIEQARAFGKRLIPVVCREVPDTAAPEYLRRLNYIFFAGARRSFGKALASLTRALSDDINWIREHTQLAERAARWNANERGAVYLLRGEEVGAAKTWLARQPAGGPEPTLLHRGFVAASEAAEADRQVQERTREALAKDTEIRRIQAEQEADRLRHESDRLKAENELARRLRRTQIWGAGVALTLLVGTGGLWMSLRNRHAQEALAAAVAEQKLMNTQNSLELATARAALAEKEKRIADLTKNQLLAKLEAADSGDVVRAPSAAAHTAPGGTAAAPAPAAANRISPESLKILAQWEVGGEEAYQSHYSHPTSSGMAGGIAIGIGYDLGFVSQEQFKQAWSRYLPPPQLERLMKAVGIKGSAARNLTGSLADISIPWTVALDQFRDASLPPIIAQIDKAMPNARQLSPDSFGALVSLGYSRGTACFTKEGSQCEEMRRIRELVENRDFAGVPDQIRKMKRLWPNFRGLQARRDAEAALFESGLGAKRG
jgi:hypothetical protein